MREILLSAPVERDGISYAAGAVVRFDDSLAAALIAGGSGLPGVPVLIALARSAPRFDHAQQVALRSSGTTSGPRAQTGTAIGAGVVFTVVRMLGTSSTLALLSGSSSNLSIDGGTGAISATAAIAPGADQLAIVREAAGRLAVEYPVTITGQSAATPAPTPTPTPTPTPPQTYTTSAASPSGTDLGAFSGTLGSIRIGDRPLSNAGTAAQFLSVAGGRLLVGSDF